MNRVLAWGLGLLLALVLTIGGAGAFLLWRLDPKAELERQIEAATGRDATIAGEVSISYFPTLGLTAHDVSLANMPGGRAAHMVTAEEIRIGVAAQALVDRRLVVRDLVLREPVIALEISAAGEPNWIFPAVAKRPPPKEGADPLGELRDVTFGDVRIENGRMTFDDLGTEQSYGLEEVDARAELDTLSGPLAIRGGASRNGERMNIELRFGEGRRLLTGGQTSMVAKLAGAGGEASFEGVLASGGAEIDGKIDLKGESLRRTLAWVGDAPAPGGGLARYALSGQLAFNQEGARFDNALFTLDGANGRGSLRLETKGERPLVTGSVQIAALDLNPYLAAPAGAGGAGGGERLPSVDASAEGWDKTAFDLAGLKGLDARIALTSGPVKVQNLTIDSARGNVALNAGLLAIRLEEATLYGGSVEGGLALDARGEGLALRQDLIFNSVSAAALLKDAVGLDALEGVGQVEVTLSGGGVSQDALIRSLDGQIALRLADGALKGVNLSGVATSISRAIRGEFVGPRARTKFSTFAATFTIADGVAATRDLRLRADDAEITAVGAIDLGAQRLDLRIVPRAENVVSRMGLGFARLAVPFHISGPWTKPTYRTDLAATAQSALLERVRAVEVRSAERLRAPPTANP